jgi:L-ascorbate metabolism protein UlaG (beta-lactamase superfamily)
MDPNLCETFREGTFGFNPRRRVYTDRMPPVHVILISHRHRDHFDLRSLQMLPREALVLYPPDEIIAYALNRLGFRRAQAIDAWSKTQLSTGLHVVATPSLHSTSGRQEVGFAVVDDNLTFWNLADTALAPAMALAARRMFGHVDVAFYPLQPMVQAEFVQNRANVFPVAEYSRLIRGVQAIEPGVVVPSSCGYEVLGDNAWINHFKFPVSHERIARDLAVMAPSVRVCSLRPGDAIQARRNTVAAVEQQTASGGFVESVEDHTAAARLYFDPTGEVAPLREAQSSDRSSADLRAAVAGVIRRWGQDIAERSNDWELWYRWGLTYEFCIVFPDGVEHKGVDFSHNPVRIHHSGVPLADFTLSCTATTLLELAEGRRHFDHQLSGAIRVFSRMYRPTAYGLIGCRDLLPEYSEERLGAFGLLRLLVDADGGHERRVIEHELACILRAPDALMACG